MDVNEFLYAMPEVAQEQILKNGVQSVNIGDGVSRLNMNGFDRGIAYKFFLHPVYNKTESDKLGYEKYDEVEAIQWFIDRKNKPVEEVKALPDELIRRNREGVVVGGRYKEAYLNWKSGQDAPGTPLRRWGILSDAEVASLEADGIFTVEQYTQIPRERIAGKYPIEFVEAHDRARQFLAGREIKVVADKQSEELVALKKENSDLAQRLAKLEAMLGDKAKPKKDTSLGSLLED
jgi:hypothetical protein